MKRFSGINYGFNREGLIHKFEPKSYKGILLGYASNNTYRIYLPERDYQVRNERVVEFNETMNKAQLLKNEDKKKYKRNDELKIINLCIERKKKLKRIMPY